MSRRLLGKRAIVTGAGSGIGRASAVRFAAEGAKVLAVDRERAVEDVVRDIRVAGGTAIAMTCDAGDETQVREMVASAVKEFGGLDVVYANAGISGAYSLLSDITPEQFMEVLRVNLLGPFLAAKHAAPHMVAQGNGSLIFTASVAGLKANAGPIPYSASKAGVVSLVQTLANQLRATGVRVNAICPGLIETGMTKPLFDYARARGTEKRIGQLNPTGRYGVPDEIANVALFLASDEASYVDGQAIPVDGGLTSTHPFLPPKG